MLSAVSRLSCVYTFAQCVVIVDCCLKLLHSIDRLITSVIVVFLHLVLSITAWREYAIFSVLLVQQAKNAKIKGVKII